MNRLTVVLLAALEAAVSALVGLGVALVPLMLLWAIHFGLEVEPEVFLRAAGDVWLLGHGVDLTVTLDAVTAELTGVPGAEAPFTITIALLGFALVTVLFGRRIGRRSAAAGHAVFGGATAIGLTALVGLGVGVLANHPAASARIWEAALAPAGVIAIGVVIGAALEALRLADLAGDPARPADPARSADPARPAESKRPVGDARSREAARPADAAHPAGAAVQPWSEHPLAARILALPPAVVVTTRAAARIGVGAAFTVVGVAAAIVTLLIALDYSTVVGLAGTLDAGVDGGIALVVGELAVLPNLIVWTAAWLLGPGFAFGAGTSISPTATMVGPLPGVPILGIVPTDGVPLGLLWLLVPLAAGFAGATFVWPWLADALAPEGSATRDGAATAGHARDADALPVSLRPLIRRSIAAAWWMPPAVAAGAGIAAGAVMGVLAWWSAGAVGPGRLAQVGPEPIPVALMAAATVFVGALAGAFTTRALGIDPGHAGGSWTEPLPSSAEHRAPERVPAGASDRDAQQTEPFARDEFRGIRSDRRDP